MLIFLYRSFINPANRDEIVIVGNISCCHLYQCCFTRCLLITTQLIDFHIDLQRYINAKLYLRR